jgi:hypothetical protein
MTELWKSFGAHTQTSHVIQLIFFTWSSSVSLFLSLSAGHDHTTTCLHLPWISKTVPVVEPSTPAAFISPHHVTHVSPAPDITENFSPSPLPSDVASSAYASDSGAGSSEIENAPDLSPATSDITDFSIATNQSDPSPPVDAAPVANASDAAAARCGSKNLPVFSPESKDAIDFSYDRVTRPSDPAPMSHVRDVNGSSTQNGNANVTANSVPSHPSASTHHFPTDESIWMPYVWTGRGFMWGGTGGHGVVLAHGTFLGTHDTFQFLFT